MRSFEVMYKNLLLPQCGLCSERKDIDMTLVVTDGGGVWVCPDCMLESMETGAEVEDREEGAL